MHHGFARIFIDAEGTVVCTVLFTDIAQRYKQALWRMARTVAPTSNTVFANAMQIR